MRRLSRTILLLLLILTGRALAEPVASLITVGPGDEVWENFGHNMIRIRDDARGVDVCWNWGVFDFNKPGFILNFVKGRMVYTMQPSDTQLELDEYRKQNRHVTEQQLNLDGPAVMELWRRCYTNFKTNPEYRYDYFQDNCSTRVRDMLDGMTNNAFSQAMKGKPTQPPVTFRHEAVRLMQGDLWISLGADFAIGPNTDKPLDLWAEGFLPEQVARTAEAFTGPRTELWPSTRPPAPTTLPVRWPWLLLTGLLGGGAIVGLWRYRRWMAWTLVAIWWLISGFGGWFMLCVWLFTDHTAGYANQNLWHYSPLAWVALLAVIIRFRPAGRRLSQAIVALSLFGCLAWIAGRFGGPFAQPNGQFILLALPLNLAAAWVAGRSLTKPPAADEVAGL